MNNRNWMTPKKKKKRIHLREVNKEHQGIFFFLKQVKVPESLKLMSEEKRNKER